MLQLANEEHGVGDGHDFQTKAEVLVIVNQAIKDYELQVVAPRHRETQGSLRNVILLLVAALAGLATNLIVLVKK